MQLGSRTEFRLCTSPCQLYRISRMDAEDDNQDFCPLDSTIYPFESVMLFLRPKGPFIDVVRTLASLFLDHAGSTFPLLDKTEFMLRSLC